MYNRNCYIRKDVQMSKKKLINIVGAGLSGATLARKFVELGYVVYVYDKRDHIGGNVYDYVNEYGIRMSKYGAHIFHTSDEEVWNFVNTYSDWLPYQHRVKSFVNGSLVSVPVNIDTFNTILGSAFTNGDELQRWIDAQHPEITNPKNSEESALKRIGSDIIYELMFKNYTYKQWNKYPAELEAAVMERIPVRVDHNDRYFGDTHEGMPANGYTELVKNILDHPDIHVVLGVDYDASEQDKPTYLFYSGKIDSYFSEKFGKLEYRSLRFEHETLRTESYQDASVVNYPESAFPYTRIIEHKKLYMQYGPMTTITREYSTDIGEPYYPVPTQENRDKYARYQAEAEKLEKQGIYFVGRLANYKYFNMDQAIRNALNLYEKVKSNQ